MSGTAARSSLTSVAHPPPLRGVAEPPSSSDLLNIAHRREDDLMGVFVIAVPDHVTQPWGGPLVPQIKVQERLATSASMSAPPVLMAAIQSGTVPQSILDTLSAPADTSWLLQSDSRP